jgi:tetratricopeptide (TPR) repeat protein
LNDWLQSWQSIFKETEKKWALLSSDEQKDQLNYLEETAGALLDTWTELDEKINGLREDAGKTLMVSYESRGTTLYELDMFEQALEELQKERTSGEKDEIRRLYIGFSSLFAQNLNKAKETFIYILQASTKPQIRHFAYVGLGCVQTQEDRVDDAIASFQSAKQLTSTKDVVYNLGICYFYEEAFQLAKEYFMTYCEQEPNDGEALFYLGCCQWQNGEIDVAWASWTTSIHLLNSLEALMSLAYVCEWHGYHFVAVHCYRRILEKHGTSIRVLHGLAWNYALMDDKENALKYFREGLWLDPSNQNIKKSLNWLGKTWPEIRDQQFAD